MKLFTINGVYRKTSGKLKMVFKRVFVKHWLNNWPCKSEVKGTIYQVAIATVIFPQEKLSSCFRSKVHLLFVWCLYNHDNTVEPCLEPRYYGNFFWPDKTATHFLIEKPYSLIRPTATF